MKCIVCNGEMTHFFNKEYREGDKKHEFVKCSCCGLVINKTVYMMPSEEWSNENNMHIEFQGKIDESNAKWEKRIGRIKPQAKVLADIYYNNIFSDNSRSVDYGCGDGLLSDMLQEEYRKLGGCSKNLLLGKYEKFLKRDEYKNFYCESDMKKNSFDIVCSSAVLEHIRKREDFENLFELVNEKGVFVLHTLICEEVPCDPNWFYVSYPVHCTVWTNKAMNILYKRYGFVGCAYHLPSKMWFFFKDIDNYYQLYEKSSKIVGEWSFSFEYVDYWKKKPYHN